MWGVTARVARADGYRGEMRDLPRERAKDIYRRMYWDAVRADELQQRRHYAAYRVGAGGGQIQDSPGSGGELKKLDSWDADQCDCIGRREEVKSR